MTLCGSKSLSALCRFNLFCSISNVFSYLSLTATPLSPIHTQVLLNQGMLSWFQESVGDENMRDITHWFFRFSPHLVSRAVDIESRLCGSYGCDLGIHIRRGDLNRQDLYVPLNDPKNAHQDNEIVGVLAYLNCVRDLARRIASPDYGTSQTTPRVVKVYVATDQPYILDLVKQVLEADPLSTERGKYSIHVVWNDSDHGRGPDGARLPALMDQIIVSRSRV